MNTKEVLKEMLTTSTGSALCDSGGIPSFDADGHYVGSSQGYGRAWERNQGRDFDKEPVATLSFKYGEPSVSLNIYHWLMERLDYDAPMDAAFQVYLETPEARDSGSYLADMEGFAEWLQGRKSVRRPHRKAVLTSDYGGFEVGGCREIGSDKPFIENSYNHEELIDQTIQYMAFSVDDTDYILLQVHQGCDVESMQPA